MYFFAYALLLLAMFCSLAGGALALLQLWQGRFELLHLAERAQLVLFAALLVASACLLHALFWHDFSLQYVAGHTDRILPVFYRLTAFWAGQAGSLLFWALSVSLAGAAFVLTPAYRALNPVTRSWFLLFFSGIMAFFGLLLTSWSNPFLVHIPTPPDGSGLNPLLQHPGMIFHPPLLFWGYGGFAIPGCLALAQHLSGRRGSEASWISIARPFTLLAWLFLTAGIVLGAWWAYMELGWGGYWAWDPVENASLIPWLVGTAAVHTSILEERRGKLARVNVALMSLTTVSAFFATYLVRSGVIDSVHAFGDGGVGMPLLVFILAATVLCILVACLGQRSTKALSGIDSREGFLTLAVWVLLTLSVVIWIATLWPVISKLWGTQAQGLGPEFYNKVCLPLFAMLTAILAMCPWMRWDGGLRDRMKAFAIIGCALGAGMALWFAGYSRPTAFISSTAAFACLAGFGLLMAGRPARDALAAYGVHLGVALMVLGVAFSGAYKQEADLVLGVNETGRVGAYEVRLTKLGDGEAPGFHFLAAELEVLYDGKTVGALTPERRMYEKFGSRQFAQADTIFSLGNEVYASLLGLEPAKSGRESRATVKVSVHPLVNWLWIGGTLMCLFPFVALYRRTGKKPERGST
ncbi:MAG: cytochrome c biogenesis protein CcsA [Deltaproteobacteria bacterium]|jgi:cytochrome c-type biogenesis protein CcmF|nr:cytochrome c biogenesis protein CcsA [Deltaproteobacteria bacterium]